MAIESVTSGSMAKIKQASAKLGVRKSLSRSQTRYKRRQINGRVGNKLNVVLAMAKTRILLVEDVPMNRMIVRGLVQKFNVELEEAENGKEAVDLIQKKGRIYDLILMDKQMPIMDGHEATRKLRVLGVTTPIIALSSNSLQSDQDLFIQAGANEFHPKPLSRDMLVEILAKYGMD